MKAQPRKRTPKRAIKDFKKAFREKKKSSKQPIRRGTMKEWAEKNVLSLQQIFEVTIKRLHTLGGQKFGSSPFSEHFDRWLLNVEAVLDEFEAHPEINVDEQFRSERTQALADVRLQLENRRKRESHLDDQIKLLSNAKTRLKQVNIEYATKTTALKGQKNSALKRLNKELDALKKEQDHVIKLKTGFFRGISKREREQKEADIMQQVSDKQQEIEVTVLDFKEKLKNLQETFERKRDPLLEEVKVFQKRVRELEEDSSLEERWFACETLIDTVNNFFQRKLNPNSQSAN